MPARLLAASLLAAFVAAPAAAATAPALVYHRAGAVWIAGADGSQPRRLAAGALPDLSPDGRRVAFLRGQALFVVQAGGGSPRLLLRGAAEWKWSPDSRRLAAQADGRLLVLDVETGARVTLDRAPARFDAFLGFSFSPAGDELVWARPVRTMGAVYTGDLFRAPIRGGPPERLTRGGRGVRPVWGPDAIAFAAFAPGTAGKPFDRPFRLWAIRPDGSGLRRLSPERYLIPVAWSADGSKLLACSIGEFSCAPAAVDPGTGAVRYLLPDGPASSSVARALSGDGRLVLAEEGALEGPSRVVAVPYAGGRLRVLARGADSPDWTR